MRYAPILIPTCNRIKHLKRCIHSIEMNKLAGETEIYISVDFPPSSKYKEGYDEVLEYVKNNIKGFKKVHVYIQSHNLGPTRNIEFLYKACFPSDRWILTEDDNEFSQNFLEYMNQGLEYFKDDKKVFFICAYLEKGSGNFNDYNCYTSSYYQPYGVATWRTKFELILSNMDKVVLDPYRLKLKKIIWLYRENPWCFSVYINHILLKKNSLFWKNDNSLNPTDGVIQLYLLFTNQTSMFPTRAKSRTWGNDGSGYTMAKEINLDPSMIILDDDEHFVIELCENENSDNSSKSSYSSIYIFKIWIKYILYRVKHL